MGDTKNLLEKIEQLIIKSLTCGVGTADYARDAQSLLKEIKIAKLQGRGKKHAK